MRSRARTRRARELRDTREPRGPRGPEEPRQARQPRERWATDVRIAKGTILVYRVLDIADEIDLPAAERRLRAHRTPSRMRLARSTGQALIIANAPVHLSLGKSTVRVGERQVTAETSAKLWDYGVLSIQFQVPIPPGTRFDELTATAAQVEDDSDFEEVARRHAHEVTQSLGPALEAPHEWEGVEDYVIYFLEQVEGLERPGDLLHAVDVPALILGEPAIPLARRMRAPILESVIQYGDADLAVIDWNSAVVVEPSGQHDVPDVLEFALTHLMEYRYYDDLLDQRLAVLYGSMGRRRPGIFGGGYSRLSREASQIYLELSEFLERVENSLKVVGDFHLAMVFRAATQRFRLGDWEASITRKMGLLARVSELLQGELNVWRSHLLEIIIIALITFEIVSALLKIQ